MKPVLAAFITFAFALPVFAQFTIPGAGNALLITLSPAHPRPGEVVRLTLQSYFYGLNASVVVWKADGTIIAQGVGVVSASVVLGDLGTATDITADISGVDGSASAQLRIIPTYVNLLWESDSYIPPFYKGRALPSAGSMIKIVALPHFVLPGGLVIPQENLVYTWRKDGQILEPFSGRGKLAATIDGPTLRGAETISVDVSSADGVLSGEAIARISDTKPMLLLYEDHPLFGVLFGQALGAAAFIPDTEMSFAAIPYFAPARPNDPALQYEWHVNQAPIAADPAHANEITISAASSTEAVALIQLSLTHATNYFLTIDNAWSITLNKSRSGMFGADPFHQ